MKLGLVTYQMAAQWDVERIIQMCGKHGYEGMELRTTHKHAVEPDISNARRTEVRRRFADSPVTLWGLGTVCEFHAVERKEVERNVQLARDFVLLAQDVGAAGIKVRPNGLQRDAGIGPEQTLEQIGRAFREVGQFGADHGVEAWMEVHGPDTCAPDAMRRIMEAADHPNCFVCWNSNMTDLGPDGDVEPAFNLLKRWVRSCHINELTNRAYPYRTLFRLLRECGYERFTLAEIQGTSDPDRFLPYYRALWEELGGRG